MKKNKTQLDIVLRFGCFDAIFWCIMASFGSYVVPMALQRGYTQSAVGIMVSGYLVSAFAGQFFWASICDQLRATKKVFLLGVSLTVAAQLLLYFTRSALLFGLLYICLGFTLQPMGSILDAWMLKALKGSMKSYAPARGGGSIGYAVAVLAMGKLVARFGYGIMPVCSTAIAIVVLAIAYVIPDAVFSENSSESPLRERVSWKTTLSILKNKSYLLVLAVVFFLGMAIAPVNTFKISILEALGGDVSTQGMDGFFSCVAQFAVFEAGALLMRIPASGRLLSGAVLTSVSIFITMIASNCETVIAATLLVGVTYGLVTPAGRERILETIDPRFQTTAIGLMDGCYSFFGGTVAMLYAGSLAEAFGLRAMLLTCFSVSLVPLSLLVVFQAAARRNASQHCNVRCCTHTCCGENIPGRIK